jgi:uncharacterized membrane protein YeaQ/YmgE (transglycosylase-associated protein family)
VTAQAAFGYHGLQSMNHSVKGADKVGFIVFLIIGGVAGWLASTFMNKDQGILMNIVVGIIGAYVGGFLGGVVGLNATGFIGSIIMATIGAVILLWILGKLKK